MAARLVRSICHRVDQDDDPSSILKACIAAALEHDLTPAGFEHLLAGVEARLDLSLTPISRVL